MVIVGLWIMHLSVCLEWLLVSMKVGKWLEDVHEDVEMDVYENVTMNAFADLYHSP